MKLKMFTEEVYQTVREENSKENPFDISEYDRESIKEWHHLKDHYSIRFYVCFNCLRCNKKTTAIVGPNIGNQKITALQYCKTCTVKLSSIEKYGVDNYAKTTECKEKTKQTNLRKYGVESHNQSDKVKCKKKNTYRKRYKKDSILQVDSVKEKIKKTNLERYGSENVFASEEIKERIKQYNLDKYGVEYASQSESVRQKTKNTLLKRYGVDNYAKTKEYKRKCQKTNLKRYGVTSYSKTEEFHQRYVKTCKEKYGVENTGLIWSKYKYNNINFDSTWELAFYIYHIDKKHKITRNYKFFIYVGDDKILHRYFPDFKICGRYYEIKGDQFIEFYKNGNPKTLKNNHAKYNCMKKHKVTLLWSKQIKKYINYVDNKYGKGYLKQFKINKDKNKENEE